MGGMIAEGVTLGSVKKVYHVEANRRTPLNTSLNFRAGAMIDIVSSGWARYGPDQEPFGACGRFGVQRLDAAAPDENIGALLVKTGGIYTPVNGGRLDWKVPTDDNLELVCNDTSSGYTNNSGSFDVTIRYKSVDLQS